MSTWVNLIRVHGFVQNNYAAIGPELTQGYYQLVPRDGNESISRDLTEEQVDAEMQRIGIPDVGWMPVPKEAGHVSNWKLALFRHSRIENDQAGIQGEAEPNRFMLYPFCSDAGLFQHLTEKELNDLMQRYAIPDNGWRAS